MTWIPQNATPALSLHRPWAALILHGDKDVENRTWRTSHRGLLFLHAAKTWDTAALQLAGRVAELPGFSWRREDHPTGIVGAVEVVEVCSATVTNPRHRCTCGPWAIAGQHHWRLHRPAEFDAPISCNGRQRLWALPRDVWPLAEAALARAEDGSLT